MPLAHAVRLVLVAGVVVGLAAAPSAASSSSAPRAEAAYSRCHYSNGVPAATAAAVKRAFTKERQAPAGAIGPHAWRVRCAAKTIVHASVQPPAGVDCSHGSACLPYQDDAYWSRQGSGPWKLLGGIIACTEFPDRYASQYFKRGLCVNF